MIAHDIHPSPPPPRGATRKRCHAPLPAALVAILAFVATAVYAEPRRADVQLDSTTTVTWDSASLILTWQEVADSRCPSDAVCVWEGQVAATLQVQAGDGEAQTLTLTRQYAGDPRASASVVGYGVRLVDVEPYPLAATPTPRAAYVARLLVTPPGEALPRVDTAVEAAAWGQVKRGSPR